MNKLNLPTFSLPAVFSLPTAFLLSTLLLACSNNTAHSQVHQAKKHQNFQSEYTSLKAENCRTIEFIADHAGSYHASCPAKAPYQLEVEGIDLRYGLNVIYDGSDNKKTDDSKPKHTVRYWYPQFFQVGDTVEWRYSQNKQGQKNYHALIYRVYSANQSADYSDNGDENGMEKRDKQELFVVRLDKDKSCILGKIPASKDMNVKARQLADDMTANCPIQLNNGGVVKIFLGK